MLQFNVSDTIWYNKNTYFLLLYTDFLCDMQFNLQNLEILSVI